MCPTINRFVCGPALLTNRIRNFERMARNPTRFTVLVAGQRPLPNARFPTPATNCRRPVLPDVRSEQHKS